VEARRQLGFGESWNTTQNAVEKTGLAHNHGLLILDETKRAGRDDVERGKVVLSMAVALAEHTEKERLTNPGSARGTAAIISVRRIIHSTNSRKRLALKSTMLSGDD
jgi:uncharacterized protein (DUF927 family)